MLFDLVDPFVFLIHFENESKLEEKPGVGLVFLNISKKSFERKITRRSFCSTHEIYHTTTRQCALA